MAVKGNRPPNDQPVPVKLPVRVRHDLRGLGAVPRAFMPLVIAALIPGGNVVWRLRVAASPASMLPRR